MAREPEQAWKDLLALSEPECQVLFYVCQGDSNDQIALKLSRSSSSVSGLYSSIVDKFHLNDLERSQRRVVIGRDYCPLLRGRVHSAKTAWKDIQTEGAQQRSSSTAGEQPKAQTGGGRTASDSTAQSAQGTAGADSAGQKAQGTAGADSAGQKAQGTAGADSAGQKAQGTAGADSAGKNAQGAANADSKEQNAHEPADADSTTESAHGSADADSAGKKAQGSAGGDSAAENAHGSADADSAGKKAQGSADQGGASGRSPDLGPLEQRERPPWLWPVLFLAAAVLIGAGVTIGMLLGRGPSPTPVPFPTSTPRASAYSPSPTQAPVYASPRTSTSIPAAPTLSDVQNPAPGTVIPAGQAFTRGGVSVTALPNVSMDYYGGLGVRFEVRNESPQRIYLRWQESFLHLQDDRGHVYPSGMEDSPYNQHTQVNQSILDPGQVQSIRPSFSTGVNSEQYSWFKGPLDPKAKRLIFKIDQMAGLTDMTWSYDVP